MIIHTPSSPPPQPSSHPPPPPPSSTPPSTITTPSPTPLSSQPPPQPSTSSDHSSPSPPPPSSTSSPSPHPPPSSTLPPAPTATTSAHPSVPLSSPNHLQLPSSNSLFIQVNHPHHPPSSLPHSASNPDLSSPPTSPLSPSPSTPSLLHPSRSPQWFGASHYDQVDASFAREVADIATSEADAKADIFLQNKHRLGKATYLTAPSARSLEPTIQTAQPTEQDALKQHENGYGAGAAQRVSEPAGLPSSPVLGLSAVSQLIRQRSTSSKQRDPALPSKPSEVTPPGTEASAKSGGHVAKLGQWPSTAICANDITSSCFYAISITVQSGGIWAPLCFLIVVGVLYLFRKVYGEAVTALPLNGGAYNVLLNTTSKKTAAFAGCLSLLSYMATGVVSAASAISYLQYIAPAIPTSVGVIILLAGFAALVLWGIKDSSTVAFAILAAHMATLAVLVITMIVYLCRNGSSQQFTENIHSDVNPSAGRALLFGYASAMLGVSGFETSANFVEEQQDGVFVKTLRNMWVMVSVINPLLALLAVLILPLDVIVAADTMNVLLAYLGDYTGGSWLKYWVAIDAFLVLAAAVLTAYVGMNGLARRVALDRGLPQILLRVNRWRHTNHWIILSFLVICIVLYFIVNGDVDSLGNVYAISFLLVMSGFAVGNISFPACDARMCRRS